MASKTVNDKEVLGGIMRECIDCREYKGSTNVPPEYWADIE
jgi:hypothetical protein